MAKSIKLWEALHLLGTSICNDMDCPPGIPCSMCPSSVLRRIAEQVKEENADVQYSAKKPT